MLISRSICILIVVMTILLGSATAQQKRPQTPYGTLYNEWKAEVKAINDITPALTAAEKWDQKREVNAKFTPRFLRLAKAHLDDDLWIDCLIWTSVEGVPGADFDEMFDLLRDNANEAQNATQLQLLMSEFIKKSSGADRTMLKCACHIGQNAFLATRHRFGTSPQGIHLIAQGRHVLVATLGWRQTGMINLNGVASPPYHSTGPWTKRNRVNQILTQPRRG